MHIHINWSEPYVQAGSGQAAGCYRRPHWRWEQSKAFYMILKGEFALPVALALFPGLGHISLGSGNKAIFLSGLGMRLGHISLSWSLEWGCSCLVLFPGLGHTSLVGLGMRLGYISLRSGNETGPYLSLGSGNDWVWAVSLSWTWEWGWAISLKKKRGLKTVTHCLTFEG